MIVEVDVDLRDLAGHLRADLDRPNCAQRAGRRDRRFEGSAGDRRRSIRGQLFAVGALVEPRRSAEERHHSGGGSNLDLVHCILIENARGIRARSVDVTANPKLVRMSPAAPTRYELHEAPHELRSSRVPLRAGELAAIMGFWAFLAALSAAGRLIDPRGPELSPEIASGLLTLSFAEYSIWAVLTVPIFMLAHRFTVTAENGRRRILLFMALGLVIAILVDTLLAQVRSKCCRARPDASGRPRWWATSCASSSSTITWCIWRSSRRRWPATTSCVTRLGWRRRRSFRPRPPSSRRSSPTHGSTALRSQLNPHFLFNTLNAISSLVERDPRGVRKMIARLGELLRHTLEETESQEIVLERELELLRRYLEIMEVRFQGRLVRRLHADERRKARARAQAHPAAARRERAQARRERHRWARSRRGVCPSRSGDHGSC